MSLVQLVQVLMLEEKSVLEIFSQSILMLLDKAHHSPEILVNSQVVQIASGLLLVTIANMEYFQ